MSRRILYLYIHVHVYVEGVGGGGGGREGNQCLCLIRIMAYYLVHVLFGTAIPTSFINLFLN